MTERDSLYHLDSRDNLLPLLFVISRDEGDYHLFGPKSNWGCFLFTVSNSSSCWQNDLYLIPILISCEFYSWLIQHWGINLISVRLNMVNSFWCCKITTFNICLSGTFLYELLEAYILKSLWHHITVLYRLISMRFSVIWLYLQCYVSFWLHRCWRE